MYSLTNHEPYKQAETRRRELQTKLQKLVRDGGLEELEQQAVALEDAALDAETEALLNARLQKKADEARKCANDAATGLVKKSREVVAINRALEQLGPVLESAKAEAKAEITRQARKDHEVAAQAVVDAAIKLHDTITAERKVYEAFIREVGVSSKLVSVAVITTLVPGAPDGYTPLGHLIKVLKSQGYDIKGGHS